MQTSDDDWSAPLLEHGGPAAGTPTERNDGPPTPSAEPRFQRLVSPGDRGVERSGGEAVETGTPAPFRTPTELVETEKER